MGLTSIAKILGTNRQALSDQWVQAQTDSGLVRSDLISGAEVSRESGAFLQLLDGAVTADRGDGIRAGGFRPVLQFLEELSLSRSRQGFSPSETAGFVLSLKKPLFEALGMAHANDSAALAESISQATGILDGLAMHTFETFLKAREEVIRSQQSDMLELSTPVVQIWDGIVALPLIGTLDSNRTSIVMETLLQTIVQTRSEIAIIDITGVPTVDTQVAQHLLKTVAAARLMGADCIISGIRPQIAQTMVHLQIDLGNVITKATMAEALKAAMSRSGFVVIRRETAAGTVS